MLTVNFDLTEFESVEVIPIADTHCGNPLFLDHKLKEVIDYILEELPKIAEKLRAMSPLWNNR